MYIFLLCGVARLKISFRPGCGESIQYTILRLDPSCCIPNHRFATMRAIYESTSMGNHGHNRVSTANLSFLAGAGSVLLMWWIQERRRRRQLHLREREGYSSGPLDDLQLYQDGDSHKSHNKRDDCIYLDYNGTTPITPQVLQAMMPYLTR